MMILFGFIPGLSMGQNPVNKKDFIRLGVSQVNITPEQPVIMSGYDARKLPDHFELCGLMEINSLHELARPAFLNSKETQNLLPGTPAPVGRKRRLTSASTGEKLTPAY